MKGIVVMCSLALLLAGCSVPKPPQPTGDWMPVNQPIQPMAKTGT